MEKGRICFRCYGDLEEEKRLDYPYYCNSCDENFYEFETIKTETFEQDYCYSIRDVKINNLLKE